MKIKDLYAKLALMYPTSLSCEWDNDGLMCCSDSSREVKKVLIALDVTDDTVTEAINGGYDLIISHHPLIFKPIFALNESVNVSCKLIKLIQNDISVMSFHTRLDAADGGVNDILAGILNLTDTVKFGDESTGEDSIGRIGSTVVTELSDFALSVKKVLNSPFVLYSGDLPVHKVAVVGGDGKDYIKCAKKFSADTYVTGRASYNITAEAKNIGINIIEAGHFYTEDPVCKMLCEVVTAIAPEIITHHFNSNNISAI